MGGWGDGRVWRDVVCGAWHGVARGRMGWNVSPRGYGLTGVTVVFSRVV